MPERAPWVSGKTLDAALIAAPIPFLQARPACRVQRIEDVYRKLYHSGKGPRFYAPRQSGFSRCSGSAFTVTHDHRPVRPARPPLRTVKKQKPDVLLLCQHTEFHDERTGVGYTYEVKAGRDKLHFDLRSPVPQHRDADISVPSRCQVNGYNRHMRSRLGCSRGLPWETLNLGFTLHPGTRPSSA